MNTVNELFEREPLLGFSTYTTIQKNTISGLGGQIRQLLDNGVLQENKIVCDVNEVTGLFWLWVLGAYEITRTMCQAKVCFSENAYLKLLAYKKQISILRMPFAKQEYRGQNKAVANELSVSGVDFKTKDFKYNVNGTIFGIRKLTIEFEELMNSLKREDILKDHRESYSK